MKKPTWGWVLLAFAVALLMWAAGWIPNFSMGVGVFASLILIEVLPEWRKLTTAVVVGIVLCLIVPPTWEAAMRRYPRLQQALDQRTVWSDIQLAEQARVHGLDELTSFRRWCDRIERHNGTITAQDYETLYQLHTSGKIPRRTVEALDKNLRGKIVDHRKWQEECANFLLAPTGSKMSAPVGAPKDFRERIVSWFTDSPRRTLWAVAVLMLVATAITAVAGKSDKLGILNGAKAITALVIVALLVDWFMWGGGTSATKSFWGEHHPTVSQVTQPHPGYIYRHEVELKGANEWTAVGHLIPPCTRYTVDVSRASNPHIKFADGLSERIENGKEFGWRTVKSIDGEGVVSLWLFEPGKSCRQS